MHRVFRFSGDAINATALTLFVAALAFAAASCDATTSNVNDDPADGTPTIDSGQTFVIGETETVAVSGVYLIPAGATLITTRCFGAASLSFDTVDGQSITNTCDGNGSSRQTNVITGVTMVIYEIAAGAFTQVTIT